MASFLRVLWGVYVGFGFTKWLLAGVVAGAVACVLVTLLTYAKNAARSQEKGRRFLLSALLGIQVFFLAVLVAAVATLILALLLLGGGWLFSEIFP